MTSKICLALGILIMMGLSVSAQIKVNPSGYNNNKKKKRIPANRELLKQSNVYFFCEPINEYEVNLFTKAIERSNWEYFNIKFIRASQEKNLREEFPRCYWWGYNSVNDNYYGPQPGGPNIVTSQHWVSLILLTQDGRELNFGRIELDRTMTNQRQVQNGDGKYVTTYVLSHGLTDISRIAWGKFIDFIPLRRGGGLYFSQRKVGLKKLTYNPLYVPSNLIPGWQEGQGMEQLEYLKHPFKDYPYPLKVISKEELSKKILNSKESIYYIMHVNSSNRYITVWNGHTDLMMYSASTASARHLQESDIKRLVKQIQENDW